MKKIIIVICLIIAAVGSLYAKTEVYKEKGKYGLQDQISKKKLTAPVYDDIQLICNDYALAWKNGNAGVLNNKGKEFLKCKYNDIVVYESNNKSGKNSGPIFWVKEKGAYHVANKYNPFKKYEFADLVYAPDKKLYGAISGEQNSWIALGDIENDYIKNADKNSFDDILRNISVIRATKNEMVGKRLSAKALYFNNGIYDSTGRLIKKVGNDMKIISMGDNGYALDLVQLIDLSSLDIYTKLPGQDANVSDGIYQCYGGKRKYLNNNKVYSISASQLGKGLFEVNDNGKCGLIADDQSIVIPISYSQLKCREENFGGETAIVINLKLIPGMEKNIGIDYSKPKTEKYLNLTEIFDNLKHYINTPLILNIEKDKNRKNIVAVGKHELDYIIDDADNVKIEDDLILVEIDNGNDLIYYDGGGKSILSGVMWFSETIIENFEGFDNDGEPKVFPIRHVYYRIHKDAVESNNQTTGYSTVNYMYPSHYGKLNYKVEYISVDEYNTAIQMYEYEQ